MRVAVAGIGTDVGKTVVSAILAEKLQADYWKPIQSGQLDQSDTLMVKSLSRDALVCHPEAYRFEQPVSPHLAARLEQREILPESIIPPETIRPLIIELAGGVLSPLNDTLTQLDCYASWNCRWIIVSKHYLGSINHTLMTYECLRQIQVDIAGIIFNGKVNEASEEFILNYTRLACLGRLSEEPILNFNIIQRYAKQWQFQL
ncbi:MAG: dethiobiotin synthase [Parachlamydiales bacterium]|jgi:dethiobiotin synthetase